MISDRFKKIVVCSGHMIDQPDRPQPRFPANKENLVRDRLMQQLKLWEIAAGDLAICGGAQGTDILFAECCMELGTQVHLFLPLPQAEFLARSVHLPGANWEDRYFKLFQNPQTSVFFLTDFLQENPRILSFTHNVFATNNLWIIHAMLPATRTAKLFAVLVWDEKNQGDGPGGTADFAAQIQQAQGVIAVINPTVL
jgi:hypothetical protein